MPDFVPTDEETRHERLRIARDLHDTVAQRLAGLGFALDATIADEAIPPDRKRSLREIRFQLREIVEELRDEILALRSDQSSSIEEWLRDRLALEIDWNTIDPLDIDSRGREELQYILLELLQNAISHQGISSVRIEEITMSLTASYSDTTGLRSKRESHLPSFGRVGLHERLMRLGAHLEESEGGFVIRWKM